MTVIGAYMVNRGSLVCPLLILLASVSFLVKIGVGIYTDEGVTQDDRQLVLDKMAADDMSEETTSAPLRVVGFEPGPHQLLVLSYQRCGSSFFGRIFGMHESVMYTYEPLDGLYTHMYGTMEGWNVPSDITAYNNGSYRIPPDIEIDAVTDVLDNLLNCRIQDIPTPVLYNKFWQLFKKDHISVKKFLQCSKSIGIVEKCRHEVLADLCPHRFNSSASALYNCRDKLIDSRTSDTGEEAFRKYQTCLNLVRRKAAHCDDVLTETCTDRPFRAVKTVRATMDTVETLIQKNPNLRVIHLYRDPRPVTLSRRKFSASSFGIFSTSADQKHVNLGKEAKLYCQTVLRDVQLRRELQDKYPGIIREVIYDDFILDTMTNTRDLFEFIDVPFSEKLQKWLTAASDSTSQNSSQIASGWQHNLNFGEAMDITKACRELFDAVPHHWPTS